MLERPSVLIETAHAYRCHGQIEYINCCKEHGITPDPIGGGSTLVAQPLDSAPKLSPNCIVHKTVLFIRCGILHKCDYSADVRAQHGIDGMKVSPVIVDLVAGECCS